MFVCHIVNAIHYFIVLIYFVVALWFFIWMDRKKYAESLAAKIDDGMRGKEHRNSLMRIRSEFWRILLATESKPKSFLFYIHSERTKAQNKNKKLWIIEVESQRWAQSCSKSANSVIFAYLFLNTNVFILHAQAQSSRQYSFLSSFFLKW